VVNRYKNVIRGNSGKGLDETHFPFQQWNSTRRTLSLSQTKYSAHYDEDSSLHIILSEGCRVFCPYCDETRRVMKTLVNHIKAAHPNCDTELLPLLFVDADQFLTIKLQISILR